MEPKPVVELVRKTHVCLSHRSLLSCAHYFQVPVMQANYCGIVHILVILVMNSYNILIFQAVIICCLSSLFEMPFIALE